MSATPMEIDRDVFIIHVLPSWVQQIMSYLQDGSLPAEEDSARRVQRRAKAYTIINAEIYKRSVTSVLQRCVELEEGQEILRDIHQGECSHHASSRALVAKAFRHGFYWPTALQDAEAMVRKCNGCQRYASKTHQPASELRTIPITWPFAVWCLDMVGPFKPARCNYTRILVMVDKFTKWIEVKPIVKADGCTA
jgi:hypothetical protein